MYTMLRSRRYHDTAHTPGSAINQTAYIDRPTVQQLKVAFQETPIKLREIEQRWKGRRKEQMAIAVGADTKVQTPTLRATTHHENSKMTTNHGRSYLPSPPSTPPEAQLQDREKKSRPTTQPAAVPTSKQPKPILAYPLMPTLQPVRIVSGVYMTIPPKSHAAEYEIKLDMGDKQIVVLAGGRSLSSVSMIAAKMDAKPKVSQINIDEHDNWTESERGQWNLVVDLVERVKRKTPRVRIFDPQATITVTCSEIPDVIVQFTIFDEPTITPDRIHPSVIRSVRLLYSPSRQVLKINTTTTHRSPKPPETSFRTRRVVHLIDARRHHDSDVDSRSCSVHNVVTLACEALGIPDIRGWMESEIEALERFWASKEEWRRYVYR